MERVPLGDGHLADVTKSGGNVSCRLVAPENVTRKSSCNPIFSHVSKVPAVQPFNQIHWKNFRFKLYKIKIKLLIIIIIIIIISVINSKALWLIGAIFSGILKWQQTSSKAQMSVKQLRIKGCCRGQYFISWNISSNAQCLFDDCYSNNYAQNQASHESLHRVEVMQKHLSILVLPMIITPFINHELPN